MNRGGVEGRRTLQARGDCYKPGIVLDPCFKELHKYGRSYTEQAPWVLREQEKRPPVYQEEVTSGS